MDNKFRFATGMIKIILIVIALMVLVISRYAFILFSAAMLPSIVSIFLDRHIHKCSSATVCTFNLIGFLPYLMQLWSSASVDALAKFLLIDFNTWLVIYGAAIIGQLLYFAFPVLIIRIFSVKNNIAINALEKRRDELSDEWSTESHISGNQILQDKIPDNIY